MADDKFIDDDSDVEEIDPFHDSDADVNQMDLICVKKEKTEEFHCELDNQSTVSSYDCSAKWDQNEKKIELARLIELEECIWNTQHKLNRNVQLVSAAWERISTKTNLPVSVCKLQWKSLKDSLRYHRKKMQRKGKTRTIIKMNEDDVDWAYSECMAFMMSNNGYDQTTTVDYDSPSPSTSNHASAVKRTRDSDDPLVEAITTFNKSIHDVFDHKRNADQNVSRSSAPLKEEVTWKYMEYLLEKLPDDKQEDAKMKLVSLLMNIVTEQTKKNK